MDKDSLLKYFSWLSLLIIAQTITLSPAHALSLGEAEQAALSQSPEIKSLNAKSKALSHAAIADGQLSDPMLMLGGMNIPVNTFSFNQEPMTQVQIGLQQTFPKGRSLHYRSQQKKALSNSEHEKSNATNSQILLNTRLSWLNLYYWTHAKYIVNRQKKIFKHLVKVTESMLASNQTKQMDVVRAQLELTDLDNKIIEIDQQIDTSRAQLARWISPRLANQAHPRQLPKWKAPPSHVSLQQIIKKHPELRASQAMVAASLNGMKWAQQQYIPGFTIGVAYGVRQGKNDNGTTRPDFLTAELNMDLPIFPQNRQSKALESSKETLLASEQNLHSRYRELRQVLGEKYAAWKEQRKSASLYRRRLVPEAKQYAEATMTAYQNTQTDFPTLARAYIRELNTEIGGLKASVNRDIARANLFYLEGK
tara:strand:+ start:2670 stop:3935 length:1266 start_codon:yes stop_codon:yes gene_type:complete